MLVTPRLGLLCSVAPVGTVATSSETVTTAADRPLNVSERVIFISWSRELLSLDDGDTSCWQSRFRVDLRDLPLVLLNEREQIAVDDLGVRGGETVRETRIVDLHSPLDQLC